MRRGGRFKFRLGLIYRPLDNIFAVVYIARIMGGGNHAKYSPNLKRPRPLADGLPVWNSKRTPRGAPPAVIMRSTARISSDRKGMAHMYLRQV